MRIFKSKKLHLLFLSIVVLQFYYLSKVSQADDFQALSMLAQSSDSVDVIVTGGWNAVTGDINPQDLKSAVTGDVDLGQLQRQFVQKLKGNGGNVEQLYEFNYLPFSMLRVDQQGLNNIKQTAPNAKIWQNIEVRNQLKETVKMVGAPQSWNLGGTGKGQIVAVLDDGIDADHPMLAGKVVIEGCVIIWGCRDGKSIDFGPGAAATKGSHGTHVAGIIAGNGNGYRGVAPDAQIIMIKVLSDSGRGRTLDILIALDNLYRLFVDNDVPISAVNMSLGGGRYDRTCFEDPLDLAAMYFDIEGIPIFAASGNNGYTDSISSPACAYWVKSVGAIDKNWNVANFSNSADFLDILAPGVDVYSSINGGGMEAYDGTSMAAPHVAGAYAVMKQQYPNMKPDDLLALMKGSVVRDPRNGIATPLLKLPSPAGTPNAGTPIPSNPQPTPSQPAQPQPVPSNDGGTIAITG